MWKRRVPKGASAAYVNRRKYPFLARTIGTYEPIVNNQQETNHHSNSNGNGNGCARNWKRKRDEDTDACEICFEIVYLDDTAEPRLRLEHRMSYRCPFCNHLAMSKDEILKHLRRFHQDHHSCNVLREEGKMETICLRPTRAYYNQSVKEALEFKRDQMYRFGLYEDFQFFRYRTKGEKKYKRQRKQPWIPANWNPRHPPTSLEEPWISGVDENFSKRTPPKGSKQYFHSRSRIPMRPGDWEIDSDDESDDAWIDEWRRGGLHEFIDVDEKEKRILDLWNRYVRSDCIIGDRYVPAKIFAFIQKYTKELIRSRQKLLMFLTLFCEQRLIPADFIVTCMQEFDKLRSEIISSRMLKQQSSESCVKSEENGIKHEK